MKESNQTTANATVQQEEAKANALTVIPQQSRTINFLDPAHLKNIQMYAKLFASSMFVPNAYRINGQLSKTQTVSYEQAIANCTIALDLAMRINVSPSMLMQNTYIINGRPSLSSQFLIATVNACGRYKTLRYKVEKIGKVGMINYDEKVDRGLVAKQFDGRNIDDLRCIAYTTEKDSDDVLESAPVTISMAIREGWYTKPGSKWKTMPELMLRYRAATLWARLYAPDLTFGLRTVEEVRDIEDAVFEDVTTQVEREKREDANKTEIDIDTAQQQQPEEDKKKSKAKAVKTYDGKTVDTETGEVIDEQQQQQAQEPQPQGDGNLPGF